jgi:hypothetical protein
MTALLPRLVDALRNELQQLGEMLALLDAQREITARRSPDFIEPSIAAVEEQTTRIETARTRRRLLQEQLAHALNRIPQASLKELLPLLPPDYRPLVSALVQENSEALSRIRQRAEQNHQLLRRCADAMRRFIASLSSEDGSDPLVSPPQPISTQPQPLRDYAIVA